MGETIQESLKKLERRLSDGWNVCEEAKRKGSEDVERFDDFWIGLLAEYEELYRKSMGLE